jgi:hypothetical protein
MTESPNLNDIRWTQQPVKAHLARAQQSRGNMLPLAPVLALVLVDEPEAMDADFDEEDWG